jgi:hypothetical protein
MKFTIDTIDLSAGNPVVTEKVVDENDLLKEMSDLMPIVRDKGITVRITKHYEGIENG